MNRSSQNEMVNRRKDMLELSKSGMKTREWMQIVASKHGVSFDCIKKDWGKRKSWQVQIIDLKKCNVLIKKTITDLERYKEQLEDFAKNQTNPSCKLGALKTLCETCFKQIEFYNSYENEQIKESMSEIEANMIAMQVALDPPAKHFVESFRKNYKAS